MAVVLKIDSKALIKHTNNLEKLRKYDLPLAVRGTLNKVAFNLKQVTMPVSADKNFEKRKPNFFKANSKVVMANGFHVNSMRSTVGFVSTQLQYNNMAVQELEQQEYGGAIPKRDFVPMDSSRIGESESKMVSAPNRLKNIKPKSRAIHARNFKGSRKQKFLQAAIKAGKGGYVVAGLNKDVLRRINSIKRVSHRTVVKSTPLYSYKPGRSARIKETRFMRSATMNSASRLEKYYIEEANRRIAKAIKK